MHSRGFTLLEVIISLGILCVAVLTIAQLIGTSAEGMSVSRAQTMTTPLASARLEQLATLLFEFDDAGVRVTDLTTDVSAQNPGPGGGGLASAGTDSLETSTPGFVDYLDAHGQWVGNGVSVPSSAVFVRRWSIEPLDGSPDGLVLQVLVRPVSGGTRTAVRRARSDARFTTILTRSHR